MNHGQEESTTKVANQLPLTSRYFCTITAAEKPERFKRNETLRGLGVLGGENVFSSKPIDDCSSTMAGPLAFEQFAFALLLQVLE